MVDAITEAVSTLQVRLLLVLAVTVGAMVFAPTATVAALVQPAEVTLIV